MSRLRATRRAIAIVARTLATLAALVALRLRTRGRPARTGREADAIGRRWARALQRQIGMRLHVEGEPPSGPVAIVANHLSYLDIVALWCVVPGAFVARADLASWPLLGVASRLIGTRFIDRARRRDLLRVIPELSSVLASGRNVIFFPEATSSAGANVLPFKSALFEAAARQGVPVVGVSLQYETREPAPGATWSVCWWGDMTFLRHVFDLLKIRRLDARIRFGEPIGPSTDRKALCRDAREAVVKRFIPTTPFPFPASAGRVDEKEDRR